MLSEPEKDCVYYSMLKNLIIILSGISKSLSIVLNLFL